MIWSPTLLVPLVWSPNYLSLYSGPPTSILWTGVPPTGLWSGPIYSVVCGLIARLRLWSGPIHSVVCGLVPRLLVCGLVVRLICTSNMCMARAKVGQDEEEEKRDEGRMCISEQEEEE